MQNVNCNLVKLQYIHNKIAEFLLDSVKFEECKILDCRRMYFAFCNPKVITSNCLSQLREALIIVVCCSVCLRSVDLVVLVYKTIDSTALDNNM